MPTLHVLSAGAAQSLIEALQRNSATHEGIDDSRQLPSGRCHDGKAARRRALRRRRADGGAAGRVGARRRCRSRIRSRRSGACTPRSPCARATPRPTCRRRRRCARRFLAADAIYLPDIERSTAGAHCAAMLRTHGHHRGRDGAEAHVLIRTASLRCASSRKAAPSIRSAARRSPRSPARRASCWSARCRESSSSPTLYGVAVAARAQQPECGRALCRAARGTGHVASSAGAAASSPDRDAGRGRAAAGASLTLSSLLVTRRRLDVRRTAPPDRPSRHGRVLRVGRVAALSGAPRPAGRHRRRAAPSAGGDRRSGHRTHRAALRHACAAMPAAA